MNQMGQAVVINVYEGENRVVVHVDSTKLQTYIVIHTRNIENIDRFNKFK